MTLDNRGVLTASFYPAAHVDSARAAFRVLLASYREQPGTPSFERALSGHLVLALEAWFALRSANKEGADGNPMNEVRLLARSITENGGMRVSDRTISLDDPVIPYVVGTPVQLTLNEVEALAEAYFDAVRTTFAA